MVEPYDEQLLKIHFPSERPIQNDVFELALACCGGTSTGPYVAGVLDFIWEAFEEWEKAAAAGEAPQHKVRIRNLVGASAGGLSLGLAALCAIKRFPHVYDDRLWTTYGGGPQPKTENIAYRAWVTEINLDRLLSNAKEVESGQIYLFHSAPAEICKTILEAADAAPVVKGGRSYFYDPLELRATIGNLEGIPYALDYNNLAAGVGVTTEAFTLHRDNIAFAFGTATAGGSPSPEGPMPAGAAPDTHLLTPADFGPPAAGSPGADARTLFESAMVSTSAIPLVFMVRSVPQDPVVYQWRTAYWDAKLGVAVVDFPAWKDPPRDPLNYDATDGGLFDNRPFDVAHRRLAGVRGQNPQEGTKARRAVILIDPLADDGVPMPANPDPTKIFDVITALVSRPILQDRLDTVDLAQIKAEAIYSRYMIAPSREHPAKPDVSWSPSKSLMGAPMDAFLGFAAEAYREHDFLLGRRNAQRFLQLSLALPATHPLFKGQSGWTAAEKALVLNGKPHRPLVPLRGRAADEQPLPKWDWQALKDTDLNRYVGAAGKRADAIFHNIKSTAATGFWGWLVKFYLNIGWTLGVRGKVLDAFRNGLANARAGLDPKARARN